MHATTSEAGETILWIDLPETNGLHIKGILQGQLTQPVAIMVHGKPGWPNGYEHTRTGNFFESHGISLLRLYMYSADENTRNLDECTLETYTKDFETVVSYLQHYDVPKIFGIGHSYGGLAILNSQVPLDAAVLWDPTHGSYWAEYPGINHAAKIPTSEYELLGDTTQLAASKGYPIKIISAGRGKMIKYHDRYIGVADEPKSQTILAGAHHGFGNSLAILAELRQLTLDWLELYK